MIKPITMTAKSPAALRPSMALSDTDVSPNPLPIASPTFTETESTQSEKSDMMSPFQKVPGQKPGQGDHGNRDKLITAEKINDGGPGERPAFVLRFRGRRDL
jgi:hypothetical protein